MRSPPSAVTRTRPRGPAHRLAHRLAPSPAPTPFWACLELTALGQDPQGSEGIIWLRSCRVVRIGFRRLDDSLGVDNESRWDWQRPGVVTVECLEIERKGAIQVPKILRQREAEAELCRHLIAMVAQDLERKLSGPDELPIVFRQLWRDRYEGPSQGDDFGQRLLQSYQLCIAVRSPPPTIESNDQVAASQQLI